MSNSAMTTFASKVPTSIEQLSALGILGENVQKEYGERLVKNIKAYVNQENLQHYLDKRDSKRARVTNVDKKSSEIVEIDDEFETDIDFNSIKMPASDTKKSSYFST